MESRFTQGLNAGGADLRVSDTFSKKEDMAWDKETPRIFAHRLARSITTESIRSVSLVSIYSPSRRIVHQRLYVKSRGASRVDFPTSSAQLPLQNLGQVS
jgi:hypothetical protein